MLSKQSESKLLTTQRASRIKISVDEYHPPDKAESRKKNFNPLEVDKWGQKSIALEWTAMYEEAMQLKMDHDLSDIDAMSDSDANNPLMDIPDLQSYDNMLSEFTHVRSVSGLKHENNKAFMLKLNTLHDKISVQISKIADKLQHTKDNKLIDSYQSACDFLADVQHEIALFDEDIAQNEGNLNTLDRNMKLLQTKYDKAMIKLRNISAEHKELQQENYELSMEKSHLMLSVQNTMYTEDDGNDADLDPISASNEYLEEQQYKSDQKTSSFAYMDANEKMLKQLDINPNQHRYLYDDFEYDEDNACVQGIWQLFSKEIGFFLFNRSG